MTTNPSDADDPFTEHERKRRGLLAQLEAAPLLELFGVIGASPPGASRFRGETGWTLSFTLEGWRRMGTNLRRERLTVRRPGLSEKELDERKSLLSPLGLVHLEVRLAENSVMGRPEALLINIIGSKIQDAELEALAAELKTEKVFTDPLFGQFALDRKLDWYEGEATWNGQAIKLILEVDVQDQPERTAEYAHRLWRDQSGWHLRVLDCAARELLETANEWWSQHNDGTILADDFKARMTLESITVHPDGRFEFWFGDGDLFWGHSIEVRGSLAEGPTDASMVG